MINYYQKEVLETHYHGRCLAFYIEESFAPLEHIAIWMHPREENYLVYFFQRGEEVTLALELFFNPVAMSAVGKSQTSRKELRNYY